MYSLLYFEDGYLQYITSPKYSREYKNRYVGKLASSENLARIWRASIERTPSDAPGVRILLDRCLAACAAAPALGPRCLRLSVSLDALTALAAQSLRLVRERAARCGLRLHTATANSRQRGASTPLFNA